MNHRQKVKLARRLRRRNELYLPLFQSEGWLRRKRAIQIRPIIKTIKYQRRQELVCRLLKQIGMQDVPAIS